MDLNTLRTNLRKTVSKENVLKRFKLEKLRITAFKPSESFTIVAPGPDSDEPAHVAPKFDLIQDQYFEAMFNPSSIQIVHEITWLERQGVADVAGTRIFQKFCPQELALELILDGTGVHESGFRRVVQLVGGANLPTGPAASLLGSQKIRLGKSRGGDSVDEQVRHFLELTCEKNKETHEPNKLLVQWGWLRFMGVLKSCDTTYTVFDRDGTPLRAKLAVAFSEYDPSKMKAEANALQSPDMTHSRVVRQGDTLPQLTRQVYDSPDAYLEVARWNGLDDFRRLEPGRELQFPPLENLLKGRGPAR